MVLLIFRLIPKIRPYSAAVISFLHTVEMAAYFNLAIRDMLPVPVDKNNLNFFNGKHQITFVWIHCALFCDYKWTACLDGLVFLISSYFEA
jgi:hypothetical protein